MTIVQDIDARHLRISSNNDVASMILFTAHFGCNRRLAKGVGVSDGLVKTQSHAEFNLTHLAVLLIAIKKSATGLFQSLVRRKW